MWENVSVKSGIEIRSRKLMKGHPSCLHAIKALMFYWGCMILHRIIINGDILKNNLCLTIFWNVKGKVTERRFHCLRGNDRNYGLKMWWGSVLLRKVTEQISIDFFFLQKPRRADCASLSVLLIYFFFCFISNVPLFSYFLNLDIITSKILNKVNYWLILMSLPIQTVN